MVLHRSLVIWLLVIGLSGVYARSYEDLSTNNRQLVESSSSLNAANEDSLSVEDMIAQLDKVRIYKRSNPKGSKDKMSADDYEWHIREGEKTMEKISGESALAKQTHLSKQQSSTVSKQLGTDDAVRRAEVKRLHDRVAGWQGTRQRAPRP